VCIYGSDQPYVFPFCRNTLFETHFASITDGKCRKFMHTHIHMHTHTRVHHHAHKEHSIPVGMTGWVGMNRAKCFFTPMGPIPGPPPPWGMQKVLCKFKWHTSAPMWPGEVKPTCVCVRVCVCVSSAYVCVFVCVCACVRVCVCART
jgi:hypothetical protein